MKDMNKFIGTIEFIDGKGNLTGLRVFAILNSIGDDEIVSAIPIEMFDNGKIEFHQTIEPDEFKVISINGDKISDLLDFVPLKKSIVKDENDEVTVDNSKIEKEKMEQINAWTNLIDKLY